MGVVSRFYDWLRGIGEPAPPPTEQQLLEAGAYWLLRLYLSKYPQADCQMEAAVTGARLRGVPLGDWKITVEPVRNARESD